VLTERGFLGVIIEACSKPLIKSASRLSPTTQCNLKRQIKLCMALTVAASPLVQWQSPTMECIRKTHHGWHWWEALVANSRSTGGFNRHVALSEGATAAALNDHRWAAADSLERAAGSSSLRRACRRRTPWQQRGMTYTRAGERVTSASEIWPIFSFG
jgi:hypothetical protein